ncbi:MAG TPA: hypothetical protein DIW47_00775 [Bacteroidetes bacterium]|nr:hypothetical protein [Bacteroidota bacterium]
MKNWQRNCVGGGLIGICLLFFSEASGQKLLVSPELLGGHRSLAQQHFASYTFGIWEAQHFSLIDFEYQSQQNNIFFIRNAVLYRLPKNVYLQAGIGLKNPGSFYSLLAQYRYQAKSTRISVSSGVTWQEGSSWENSLSVEHYSSASRKWRAYMRMLLISNTREKEVLRGIAQFRLGIARQEHHGGLALNIDRFSEGKQLYNIGIFYKINLIKHEN